MAEKTTVILEALMNVSDVESKISRIQKDLKALNIPKDIATNLTDGLSKLGPLLKDYKKQLNNGFNTQKDVNNFNTLGKKIDEVFSDIDNDIKKINSKDIRLNVDLTDIKKARTDLAKYGKDLESTISSTFDKLSDGLKKKNPNFDLTFLRQGPVSAPVKKIGKELVEAFNTRDLEKYRVAYEKLRQTLNNTSASSKTKQNIAQQMGLNEKAISDVKKVEKAVDDLLTVLRIPDSSFTAFNDAKKGLEDTDRTLNKLLQDAQTKGENAFSGIADDINNTKSTMKGLTDETSEYGQSIATAADQVRDLQQSTQYFFSLRNMINLLKRGIDDAIQSVKELDAAMTETAVVTDYKVSDLWGMLPQYTQLANQLGATTQGAYKTMTLYFQQGLNQQQAFEIGAETMKMARIAGLEYAETTDMMTAALRGFNMELNETSAKRVNDVYSELAAITASDTEELGKAMQRTASIANSAGASFEGTTAFLAQAIETTREPAENIGTAMKTIVARFQEMKQNPLGIGEVDGEEVNYNKIDAALKTIGVDLKDTNGQFREFDQVMLDISAKWDTLSQSQQRYIATTAAGSRQQSRFIAMVSNYDRTMQLMEAANNSAGASDEQFGKTMDSLEAKLNKLHNAWELFTMGIANNSIIKLAVDGMTGLLNVTNALIDKLSLGIGPLKSVLSIFTAFTGLKAAGRVANSLIGGLGGLVDPQSTVKEGLKIGLFGQGKTNAQAKAITTPIVNSLRKISQQIAQITKKNNNNYDQSNFKITSKQQYDNVKKQFDQLSGSKGFKIGDASDLFGRLDKKHQQALFNNSPGTKWAIKQASMAWFDTQKLSPELTKQGKQYISSIYKGMEQGQISVEKGIHLIGQPQKWGQYFGTDVAQNFSNTFIKENLSNFKNATVRANARALADMGYDPNKFQTGSKELKDLLLNDNQRNAYLERFKKFKAQEDGSLSLAKGQVSNAGRLANDIGLVADKFTQAGYGITAFGDALSQLGGPLGAVGNGISAFGRMVTTMGSAITTATGLIHLFTVGILDAEGAVVVAGSTIAAFAAPIAALAAGFLLVRHHIKKVKEAGEEVTKTFNDINKEAQDNITKLKSLQGEFASLSQGVDINGNNVSLDDSQYQRYLEIVDEIATINPTIVEGYNAQGHAILNNNIALEETLRLQERLQKEAYQTYLSENSLQTLINARNINSDYRNNIVNPNSTKAEDAGKINAKKTPLANDVQSLADLLSISGNKKSIEYALEKYGIESLDALKSGEEEAVRKFVKFQDQIQTDLINSGVKLGENVIDGFQTLGENTEAFDAAIKPVYDNLLALISNSSAYKELAPEMRSALADGLKGIASKDLGADEMQRAAKYLMSEFQDAFDKAQPYLEQADEALNTFTQDLNEAAYNDSAFNIAESLRELARQAEAVGQVEIAEWYENQASRIEGAISNATESIADNINTLADDISKAKASFDALGEGIEDYYSLADQAHGLVETALETKNIEGEGSKTFWNTYRGLASEAAYNEHDINKAVANMKQFQQYFTEGAEGSRAFVQKIIDWQNKAFDFTDKDGKTATAHLKEFFKVAEDGTISVTDAFNELSDEQYAQLASVFDLSADGFTAVLNKLRQFGDLDFTNATGVRRALAFDDRTIKTNRDVEGQEGVKRLYYGQSVLDAETADLKLETKEKLVNDLIIQGSIALPTGVDNLLTKPIKEGEAEGSLFKQFVQDTQGSNNKVENVMKALMQSGEYNKDELEQIHTTLTQEGGLLAKADDANIDFDTLYDKSLQSITDPATGVTNDILGRIDSKLDTIAGVIAAGKVEEGYLPEVAKQSAQLQHDLIGEAGKIDSWAQLFARGKDENGYAITNEKDYKDSRDKLLSIQEANNDYIATLEKGRQAAVEKYGEGSSQVANFDAEIEAATANAALIAKYLENGAQAYVDNMNQAQQVSNAAITKLQNLNSLNLTPDQKQTGITDVLQKLAGDLQKLNWSPEQIQGYFKDQFNLDLKLNENGEFASNLGEQIKQQIDNLGNTKLNAILNIQSVNFASFAKGKNNTPSAIRRVGTMARGSKKRGYTINGEPTLTGELGPELVWEPRQNQAYMVGEHGPQFTNLSKNAVVWNAEQTKKIRKNSKGIHSLGTGAKGIHNFGTMAEGAMTLPGTFNINANASILEVVPPTPEPEIPVKAKLEVEGTTGGGLLSKIFGGGKGGPSIDVAANVTSINTNQQLQTIDVIGSITQLQNKANTAAENIDATAVVTQVKKSTQVAGEPISVKATATTTKVKNNTPAKQTSAGTQTMNVTANTSAAQSKINQLIRLFNKTYTLKYRASGPSSIKVPISANFTGSWKKTVEIHKSGANGINNKGFGSLAGGSKYGTIGPKGRGGLTLTGEEGFEIAWLPSENRSMILGANGPQMLSLPKDAVVFTNEQSKKILKQKAIPAGSHNSLTGKDIAGALGISNSTSSSSSTTKNKNKKKNKNGSSSSSASTTTVNNNWSIEEVIRFDLDRNIEAATAEIKKLTTEIDDNLGRIGTKASDISKKIQDQVDNLKVIQNYNNNLVSSFQRDLDRLAGGPYNEKISYETGTGKKKKSKEETVNLASYIYRDSNGIYQIDKKAIADAGSTAKQEAIFKAAERALDPLVSGLQKAKEAAEDAEKQMKDLGKKVSETFYQWENEITEVYNLTQRISKETSLRGRFSSQVSLELAKLETGFGETAQSIETLNTVLTRDNQTLLEQINAQQSMISARRKELNAALSEQEEIDELVRVRDKTTFPSAEARDATIKAAEDKYNAVKIGREFLRNVRQGADGNLQYEIDWAGFENRRQSDPYNKETYEAVKKYLDDLDKAATEYNDSIKEQTDLIKDTYDALKEYQSYVADFEGTLLDGLEKQIENEVKNNKQLSDSIRDSLKDLLDEVKNKLDERRKQEDNAKTESDISQKQQRLAALRADTSGGHQVEIAQLEKEIAEAQQSYGRTLEDQLLDRLQQQADKAAEQRNHQIEIAEAQLEASSETNKALVEMWMQDPIAYKTNIRDAWLEAQNLDEKGAAERQQLMQTFESEFTHLVTAINQSTTANQNALASVLEKVNGGTGKTETSSATGSVTSLNTNTGSTTQSKVTTAPIPPPPSSTQSKPTQPAKTQAQKDDELWTKIQNTFKGFSLDTASGSHSPLGSDALRVAQQHKGAKVAIQNQDAHVGGSGEIYWDRRGEVRKWNPSTGEVKKFNYNKATYIKEADPKNSPYVHEEFAESLHTRKVKGYKTGGLADQTGPAWLDGTPTKPELVLNAKDTKNFLALKDVLSHVMGSTSSVNTSYGGDTTYEININVDKIEKDYDVDRVAERVKKIIVKDAGYRNVTQVRNFR